MRPSDPAAFLQKNFVFDRTELCRADLGFIFGNRHISPELAREAALLYHRGYFPKIIVSGGVETNSGVCEADETLGYLLRAGVPRTAILLEREALNTGENVIFSLPIIDSEIGLCRIGKVISFGHFSAGPRFLMTLARHCPGLHCMHKSVFPSGYDIGNWFREKNLLEKTVIERSKIPDYLEKNFIAPVDIKALNEKTARMTQFQHYSREISRDLRYG